VENRKKGSNQEDPSQYPAMQRFNLSFKKATLKKKETLSLI